MPDMRRPAAVRASPAPSRRDWSARWSWLVCVGGTADVPLLAPQSPLNSGPVVDPLHQMSQALPVNPQPREREAFPRQVRVHPPCRGILTLHSRGVGLVVTQPLQLLVHANLSAGRDLGAHVHDALPGILLDDPDMGR